MKELKYAKIYKTQINDLAKLQAILAPHQILLDTNYLLLMEQAEEGDTNSLAELMEFFLEGTSTFKPNYELTARYAYKIFDLTTEMEDNTIMLLEAYNNLIMVEAAFGHFEKSKELMKEAFTVAIEDFNYDEVYGYIHQGFTNIVDNASFEEDVEDSAE